MTHRWIESTRSGAWLWMPMTRKRNGTREGRGIGLSIPALRELRRQVDECLAGFDDAGHPSPAPMSKDERDAAGAKGTESAAPPSARRPS